MSKIKQSEVIATRLFPSGAWEMSAIVAGYWVSKVYMGYTKRVAVRRFVTDVNAVVVLATITNTKLS